MDKKALIVLVLTFIISIGGGLVGAKIYNSYFNPPVKFYQFDLVNAIKAETSNLEAGNKSPAQVKTLFSDYLKRISKGLKKYSKHGIVFVKGVVVAGNVENITNKITAGK